MKSRPILMSAPMVRALLEGRKTQTRRIVKPQPVLEKYQVNRLYESKNAVFVARLKNGDIAQPGSPLHLKDCPYGKPGDLLWVKETYAPSAEKENHKFARDGFTYRADWYLEDELTRDFKWKPSIHMPRKASRLVLEITDVRVERLQDISEADAAAEGVFTPEIAYAQNGARAGAINYGVLWESINGAGSWDANPWVWALTFKVHQQNVDAFLNDAELVRECENALADCDESPSDGRSYAAQMTEAVLNVIKKEAGI